MKKQISKALLPMLTIVMGVSGAFFTMSAASKDALVQKFGHIRVSPNNCQQQNVLCQTEETDNACMFGTTQLWGKYNPSDAQCPEPLYRIEE
nr:DUF6520 family protein [Flavobacterium sp. ASV13]